MMADPERGRLEGPRALKEEWAVRQAFGTSGGPCGPCDGNGSCDPPWVEGRPSDSSLQPPDRERRQGGVWVAIPCGLLSLRVYLPCVIWRTCFSRRSLRMANGIRTERELLTAKEAAALIGVSVQWLYQRLKTNGGPPCKRRGRKIIISREALQKWDEQEFVP